MPPETTPSERQPPRIVFAPLKPKRRFKVDEEVPEPTPTHSPVLVNARVELDRHRTRMPRSGSVRVQWRRVTPPSELLQVVPTHSRSPILARVIDKVKNPQPRTGHYQGVWSLLRWAFAFR